MMRPIRTSLFFVFGLLLFGATVEAQEPTFQVVYQSPPGMQPARFHNGHARGGGLRDANGDGKEDLVMMRQNAQGYIDGLLVLDFGTREEIWRMEVETEDEFAGQEFIGFIRVPTSSVEVHTYAIFAGAGTVQLRRISDGPSNTMMLVGDGRARTFVAAADFDRDGITDIATYLPDTAQVEVWSTGE